MKALTIWQPWASLIALGLKPYEFRTWPAPRSIRGQRIVIHAAARKTRPTELAELLNDPERLLASIGITADATVDRHRLSQAMDLLEKELGSRHSGGVLELGVALCTAVLGEPKRCTELFAGLMDPDDINPDMWACPLTEVRTFPPVDMKGARQFWGWPHDMEWLVTP
jgi:hypothetical protein